MVHIKERRFYPFEPYAEVINEYFRLLLSFAGNLRATWRHIERYGPYYPDVPPRDGFKADYHRLGKCPGRVGLKSLLTNPVYIGHWTHNGKIIRWNNHLAIVPVDIFMQVFNYLSPVALDGTENKQFRPFRDHARPSLDQSRPVERPFYAGMIRAQINGKWHNVGAEYHCIHQKYSYAFGGEVRYWSRSADAIDKVLNHLVLEKLKTTFDDDTWSQALAAAAPNYQKERRHKLALIKTLEQTLEGYARNLPTLTNEDMIRQSQAYYEETQRELKRLTAELAALDDESERIKALETLKDDIGPALENWDSYPREKKHTILHRIIDRIEMEPTDEKGTRLIIRWRDCRTTTANVSRIHKSGFQWSVMALGGRW